MSTSPTRQPRPDLDPPRHPNRSLDPAPGSAAPSVAERVRILIVLFLAVGLLIGLAPAAAAAPAITRPGPPTTISAVAGNGWVQLTWQPPTTGGPVEYYEVSYRKAGQQIVERPPGGANARSFKVAGLPNGVTYTFWVYAANGAGQVGKSVGAQPRVIPPGEFALTSLTKRTGVVSVTWSESAAGSYPLGSYTVQLYAGYRDALAVQPVVARSTVVLPTQKRVATFIDLDPTETYFVRVIASDASVAKAYWPVGNEHQRNADRLNGYIWSIRPS